MKPSSESKLIQILKDRFVGNMRRHSDLDWREVQSRLNANPNALSVLGEMERTGGDPDVVGRESGTRAVIFVDCSPESPTGRRSLCYDRQALNDRKESKPSNAAMEQAAAIGIEMLTEAQYRALQEIGEFDRKTSSWVQTPKAIRTLGGALFCDRRYDAIFVYHNGAESYYAARGYRGRLVV